MYKIKVYSHVYKSRHRIWWLKLALVRPFSRHERMRSNSWRRSETAWSGQYGSSWLSMYIYERRLWQSNEATSLGHLYYAVVASGYSSSSSRILPLARPWDFRDGDDRVCCSCCRVLDDESPHVNSSESLEDFFFHGIFFSFRLTFSIFSSKSDARPILLRVRNRWFFAFIFCRIASAISTGEICHSSSKISCRSSRPNMSWNWLRRGGRYSSNSSTGTMTGSGSYSHSMLRWGVGDCVEREWMQSSLMSRTHWDTYASGGPLEQDGLSPTVRLYSRISTVSNWSCFLGFELLFLRWFLRPCKLSSCVMTIMALLSGFLWEGWSGFLTKDVSLVNLTLFCRCVVSKIMSVPSETVVSSLLNDSQRCFHIPIVGDAKFTHFSSNSH